MKLRFVGNAPFFSALSEEDQERVSQRMHLEHRRSGEVLFRKGDACTALYLIKSGWVRLVANGDTALASQGPGSLVGETDLFLDRPRSVGATIASDADLWVLTRDDLVDFIAENPQVGVRLTLAFGTRLALFDQYLIEYRLTTLSFLSNLPQESLSAIARRLVPVEKQEDEFIVEQGQPPEALFVVESGRVILHGSEEGGDFSEIGPGESFGEMALLTNKPHAHSAQAATDVILWRMPKDEFDGLSAEYPEIRLALSAAIREPLVAQDMSRAVERLTSISLFSDLSEEVLWSVAERLLLRHVPAGELVYAEGDPGDALYIVDSGQVEVASGGPAEHAVLARLGSGEFFGEMALLTGRPRSSMVRAATNSNLWVLYRADFDDLVNRHPSVSLGLSRALSERLAEMDRRFNEGHLRGLKLLGGLSSGQLEDVSRRLKPVRFRQGEAILREGEPGSEMFFIEAGRVRVDRASGAKAVVIAELAAGDLFGEMSLLTSNPRSATVTALTDVDLWALTQSDFDDLVAAYPNLALALSRLLSERLRSTDQLFLRSDLPAATPISPAGAYVPASAPAEPRAKPQPKRKRAPRKRRRNLTKQITNTFDEAVLWFGQLSN
ncbi:MAG: cyclic nucleotide-binding domain-containing protein, partial [Anaerolineae bacterium]